MAAVDVDDSKVWRLTTNVGGPTTKVVRNRGAGTVSISKDPAMTATGTMAFTVVKDAVQTIALNAGEALYARCGTGVTASVDVL